jgi:hypothetical protein
MLLLAFNCSYVALCFIALVAILTFTTTNTISTSNPTNFAKIPIH